MKPASAASFGKARSIPNSKLRLKEQVAEVCRFRHLSMRTEKFARGVIRTVHELLGHKEVSTTQTYTHVVQRPGLGVRGSPLDAA